MADALNQIAGGGVTNLCNQLIALFSIPGIHTHLDKLVMLKGLFEFIGYPFTETGIANDDDRFEVVSQFSKVALLRFG